MTALVLNQMRMKQVMLLAGYLESQSRVVGTNVDPKKDKSNLQNL